NIVTSNIDFPGKIQIALKVGHLKKPNDEWFSELEKTLNWIDNDLRPLRNRFVHDPIVTQLKHPYPSVRADSRATLKKPKSHQPRELTTYTETPISSDDIWKLADDIEAATKTIGLLAGRFRNLTQAASPEKP